MNPNEEVLRQFNIQGKVEFLPGGEKRTFRVGNVVLKYINNDNEDYLNCIADLYSQIKEDGFRVPRPLKTQDRKWLTSDGWSAWTFLDGNHDYIKSIPESIKAITKFHEAIKDVPKPQFLSVIDSPYKKSDAMAWGNKPENIHIEVKEMVDKLYEVRNHIEVLDEQLIHGDLNPDNILFHDSLPPAIIDIAPYYRPVEFALGIYAYWIGPWRDDENALNYFSEVREFDQMLVRAGIRMLLTMSEFNKINDLEKYKRATEIVLNRF